jgi:hypothetical protein
MISPALKLRIGAPAPANKPKSTAVSAIIASPAFAELLQSHDGRRLQLYDSRRCGSAIIKRCQLAARCAAENTNGHD